MSPYDFGVPIRVQQYQKTPNPNALKCVLDARVAVGSRAYREAHAAAGDPLARAVLAIPGVVNLLLHEDWLTVGKSPGAKWAPVKAALESVLATIDPPTL
jgi:hypothetical protein